MNLVKPAKTQIIRIIITMFFAGKDHLLIVFDTQWNMFCSEFEAHLLFLLMIFLFICVWYEFKWTVCIIVLLYK